MQKTTTYQTIHASTSELLHMPHMN